MCRSRWPRSLRRGSATARLLGLRVRIPPGAWMYVSCECCVLPGRGVCVGLITRPEESYRVWCVLSVIVKSGQWEGLGTLGAVEPWQQMYLYVSYASWVNSDHFPNSINHFVFVTETRCVFCKVRSAFLSTFFCGCCAPRYRPPEVSRSHKISSTHSHRRTPLHEWSARRRGRYLHNKHKRRTSMPSAGFEPIIPAVERLQTYAFDRAATGISSLGVIQIKFNLPNVNSTRYVLEHKTLWYLKFHSGRNSYCNCPVYATVSPGTRVPLFRMKFFFPWRNSP